jgi:hypothetical protein
LVDPAKGFLIDGHQLTVECELATPETTGDNTSGTITHIRHLGLTFMQNYLFYKFWNILQVEAF